MIEIILRCKSCTSLLSYYEGERMPAEKGSTRIVFEVEINPCKCVEFNLTKTRDTLKDTLEKIEEYRAKT